MNSRDQRAEEVFATALEMADPATRRAYLDRACAGKAALRQEVESLLAAHERAGDYLLHPAAIGARATQEAMLLPPLSEVTGTRIGRYKLLEQIGEGGFGVVWMAEQEEPVRRRVALKIIKLGMDTKEVVARFEAERQALAMMDHPNIATVFDGGATDIGRPYFVMELVKGVPITEYCDANQLSTRERLELFMQVCQAVQHAHQKGIIHRDLKPSNILVTVQDDRPVPKVIDFGVAKATQARLTQKTLFTRFHQWIGTPAYMSPEQAGLGSLDVDTRSDIYSLGVLLYELLTGRTPFDTEKLLEQGYEAVMRTVREVEPPKPSTRLSTLGEEELSAVAAQRGAEPEKLGRLVRGDLDWIVMKALEKDRVRRYETTTSLAQDIQRHLRAEPVSAAAPSRTYRLAKFVRRNRVSVAVVSVFGATLLTATLVSLQFASAEGKAERVATKERNLASEQKLKAEANAEESRQRLLSLNTAHSLQLLDGGDWFGAALWFCDALGRAGTSTSAAAGNRLRLGVTLSCAPRLVHIWFHGGPLNQAAFSPDGRWVLAAGRDGFARIWDLESDGPVGAAMPHAGPVLGAEFSRDGRYVVSACEDRTARVWESGSGKALSPPLVHRLPLQAALFSHDGRQVITASSRGGWSWSAEGSQRLQRTESEVRLWETTSGRELHRVHSRATNLTRLATSPADRLIAAAYADGDVRILDDHLSLNRLLGGSTAQPRVTMQSLGPVIQIGQTSAPPEMPKFAPRDKDDWLKPHIGAVNSLAFSPDGKYLATAGADGNALIYSLSSGECSRTLRAGSDRQGASSPALLQVAFSPDGQRIMTLASDGTVAFWSVPQGEAAGHLASPITGATSVVFSPDGRCVAVVRAAANGAGEVRVWEVASARAASPTLPHAGAVTSACFNSDGTLLLTASLDGAVRVWNLTTVIPPVPPLQDAKAPLAAAAKAPEPESSLDAIFTPDGKRVATLAGSGCARIWDTASGQPVTPVIEHPQQMPMAAFSHDATRIVIASRLDRGQAQVFDTATGKAISPTLPQTEVVRRVAFSPDDRCLVISGETGVRLFDSGSGRPLALPVKLAAPIHDLVFSPDGSRVATCAGPPAPTAGPKRTWQVQVWQIATGEAITSQLEVTGVQSELSGVCMPQMVFSQDGRWLAVSAETEAEAARGEAVGFATRVQTVEVRRGAAFSQPCDLRGHIGQFFFGPDSTQFFVLGITPGTLTVRDVARGENLALRQPQDHDYRPRELSRDGRWLLGSAQGGWRVWEVASGEPVTPVLGGGLGEVFGCQGDSLAPDGRVVLAGSSVAPQLWPLAPDQRPLEAVAREVQLLAARELDVSGSMVPLAPNRLSNLWHSVREANPAARGIAANQSAWWHLHQAGQSERAGQWFAAEFHLSRLLDTPCDGPQTRQRLAHARTQAAIEILNRNN
jgi:WD40 repeat protein/serine/threonine protein kinase